MRLPIMSSDREHQSVAANKYSEAFCSHRTHLRMYNK